MTFIALCSARPRPSVHNQNSKGNQWWRRDVYHLKGEDKRTLCGIDAGDFLTIGPIDIPDQNCCKRCASIAAQS